MTRPLDLTWRTGSLFIMTMTIVSSQGQRFTGCGGQLTSSYGIIRSPGYPSSYPINSECHWTITAESGQVVDLRFHYVDIEGVYNWCSDSVYVYDGESTNSSQLAALCGTKSQSELSNLTIRSTGNKLHIVFTSDYEGVRPGFIATYLTKDCPPFSYGLNTCNKQCDCVRNNSIGCDTLSGRCICKDGWTSANCSTPQCKSGNCKYLCYVSSTNPWTEQCYCPYWMKPVTNSSGFFCLQNYHACNSVIQDSYGYIASPGYPTGYNNNVSCEWRISLNVTKTIAFSFSEISLENHTTCSSDYVELFDETPSAVLSLGRFCGNALPGVIQSRTNNVRVVFRSNYVNTAKGFVGYFYTASTGGSTPVCIPIVMTGTSGYISSPNYPNNYTVNTQTCWLIYGPNVSLRFTSFDLETSVNCESDSVQIYDGPTASSQSLGKFCGNTLPVFPTSKSGQLLVVFTSNGALVNGGFYARYTTTATCGYRLTTPSGMLTSPGYPSGYANNLTCAWTIEIIPNQRISLRLTDLSLETVDNCFYDYIDVYDGPSYSSPRLLHACNGTQIVMTSRSNIMYIMFKSDESISSRGFSAVYESINDCTQWWRYGSGCSLLCPCVRNNTVTCSSQTGQCTCRNGWTGFDCSQRIDPCLSSPCPGGTVCLAQGSNYTCLSGVVSGCNSTITSASGYIISPNYPMNYADGTFCTWTISAPTNTIISLNIIEFNLEVASKCILDALQVFDGSSTTARLVGKYCDASVPSVIQSTTNSMNLTFTTDLLVTRKGFLISFLIHSCNNFTYGPGCSNSCGCVQNNTDFCDRLTGLCVCKSGWTGSTCTDDVNECADPSLSSTCQVNSQCVNTQGGFTCTCRPGFTLNGLGQCQVSECNRTISNTNGTIMTSNYPQNYNNNTYCTWTIISNQIGAVVTVNITEYEVEGCPYDYLVIYDGNSTSANKFGSFCNTPPGVIRSSGGAMHLVFVSNDLKTRKGFKGTYSVQTQCKLKNCSHSCEVISANPRMEQCVCPEWSRLDPNNSSRCVEINACNTTITATSGYIVSPGFPNLYTANLTCYWMISAVSGKQVSLSFTDMNIEESALCSYDYVKVLDGNSLSSRAMGQFCGNSVPVSVRSSGQFMYIWFKSDQSVSGTGFKAQFNIV